MELNEILSKINAKPILVGWRGSIAHGMYIAPDQEQGTDDKDVMAVVVPPIDCYLGLNNFASRGTQEINDGEWDVVAYELRKFVSLLLMGNPNVLSLLWLEQKHIIHQSIGGRILRANRNLFVGKHVYHSFVGYASAQLKRMTRGESTGSRGWMGAKRKEMREKYGYDVKNAAHLVRLLRMGIEFLQEGVLHVDRTDIDAYGLIDIKQGKWTLEQVMEYADELFTDAKVALKNSDLPDQPDRVGASRLCVDILKKELGLNRHPMFSVSNSTTDDKKILITTNYNQ